MEGPTPVSALIHAATMVTAGVYLIARFHPLFEIAPTAADIAAFIGLATLLVAATIALVVTDLKRIIAYSTMSQIGYMVVGVSIGAYSAGLFHLMTHAFFKALLFMAAGSVIAAMANRQNIDLMGGFRKALPFTSAALVIGALALAGFPGTSGFFSKDEILAFADERGGMYWIFAIGGYIGALMTAFYAFRIVFRVVCGEPCKEAKELEKGHLAHAEPEQPGHRREGGHRRRLPRPRAPHRRARLADEDRDVRARVPRPVRRPRSRSRASTTSSTSSSTAPSRTRPSTSSRCRRLDAPTRGLVVGGLISIAGIVIAAFALPRLRRGSPRALSGGCAPLHTLPRQQVVLRRADRLRSSCRPLLALGRFANRRFERYVVQGLVAGTVEVVRGANAGVRTVQSGYLRSYALLLVTGFAGLGLYFLVAGT